MKLAFTFPGQGSQAVGMGKDMASAFATAKQVFAEVDDALSQNLSGLMWDGPMDELTLTANAQPALMASSMAVIRVLELDFGIPVSTADSVAGHSLGEYSALCAAGTLELSTTAKLLRLRGDAMQSAVPVGVGAMAALLGASLDDVQTIVTAASAYGVCEIANDNADGQVVISGTKPAIEAAIEQASAMGVRRAVLLPVSAPFHCSLMQPAADAMAEALADVSFQPPVVPVVNNVTARPVSDPDQLKADLVTQVTGRVRWRESVQWMAGEGGIDTFCEPGTGKVLSGMLRRIVKGVNGIAINTPSDVESFAEQVRENR